jgi:hypothetical protein
MFHVPRSPFHVVSFNFATHSLIVKKVVFLPNYRRFCHFSIYMLEQNILLTAKYPPPIFASRRQIISRFFALKKMTFRRKYGSGKSMFWRGLWR